MIGSGEVIGYCGLIGIRPELNEDPSNNGELREDGFLELREDGSIELRE